MENFESFWNERNWVKWRPSGLINYSRVCAMRSTSADKSTRKGATEGMETSISWRATFSTRCGVVEAVGPDTVKICRSSDQHRYTWKIRGKQKIRVNVGQIVQVHEVIASSVNMMPSDDLKCSKRIDNDYIVGLLRSRERTQRFTGIKVARLRLDGTHCDTIMELTLDDEEDVYVRLEGASYLAAVCGHEVDDLFLRFVNNSDQQNQLEAVIVLGETGTAGAVALLGDILEDNSLPYFLRSAAAWSLARTGVQDGISRLVHAFRDIDHRIQGEALQGLVSIGQAAIPTLIKGLNDLDGNLAAGCAEALRQLQPLTPDSLGVLAESLRYRGSKWVVWLLGNLPREQVESAVEEIQQVGPDVRYAMSLLWAFRESWIAGNWDPSLPLDSRIDRGDQC